MAKDNVRIAIIGMGLGRDVLRQLKDYPRTEVAALVDLDEERLNKANAELEQPARTFTQYDAMLRKVQPDLVFVCLPNFLHKQVTVDCLEAGCAVLCEKPMALNVVECHEMEAVAAQRGAWLGIDLSFRFTAASMACRDLVNAGALGDIYHGYTSWRRRDSIPGFGGWFGQRKLSGGGALIDLGVHRLDLAMWLMGNPTPITVSGATHNRLAAARARAEGKAFDVEDLATGFIRFAEGQSLVFEISWAGLERDPEPMETRIYGTKGGLVHHNGGSGYQPQATFTSTLAGHSAVTDLETPRNGPTAAQVAVDCVADGQPFPVSPADGIRIQRILDGLYESAAKGREVDISDH